MNKNSDLLKKYTEKYTNDFLKKMSKNYTISFYTGGVDVNELKELSTTQKKIALSKSWYVRWYFKHPQTQKLVRQKNLKAGVNRLKTIQDRLEFLKNFKKGMIIAFDNGYSPYSDETLHTEIKEEKKIYTIKEAFESAHNHCKLTVEDVTAKDYYYAKEHFLNFIGLNHQQKNINTLTKKTVLSFLNQKLKETSPRTRNNYKTSLSALFTILETKLNIIDRNFIKDITNEKTKAKTDRTFTRLELTNIVNWLRDNDPYLLLYIKFVAYNFLRPIEVNRLKVKDINLQDGLLYFKAKNKPLKTKRIPSIFIEDIKAINLHLYDKEFYLFTPNNKPELWDIKATSRRDYFSKRFKKVKDKFNLGLEYGLYSFRHSFITNLFKYLRTVENKTYSQTIEVLQPITGHESKEALEKYIHTIDANIPDDWSDKIDFIL